MSTARLCKNRMRVCQRAYFDRISGDGATLASAGRISKAVVGFGLPDFSMKKRNRHGGQRYGQRLAYGSVQLQAQFRFTDPHIPAQKALPTDHRAPPTTRSPPSDSLGAYFQG